MLPEGPAYYLVLTGPTQRTAYIHIDEAKWPMTERQTRRVTDRETIASWSMIMYL